VRQFSINDQAAKDGAVALAADLKQVRDMCNGDSKACGWLIYVFWPPVVVVVVVVVIHRGGSLWIL